MRKLVDGVDLYLIDVCAIVLPNGHDRYLTKVLEVLKFLEELLQFLGLVLQTKQILLDCERLNHSLDVLVEPTIQQKEQLKVSKNGPGHTSLGVLLGLSGLSIGQQALIKVLEKARDRVKELSQLPSRLLDPSICPLNLFSAEQGGDGTRLMVMGRVFLVVANTAEQGLVLEVGTGLFLAAIHDIFSSPT